MLAVATLEKIQRRENLYRHWAFVALQMILLWHQSKLSYSAHKAVTFQRPSRKRINKLSLDVIPLFYRIHLWPHHKICVVQHENWRRKDLLYISCICTDNKIKIAVTSMKRNYTGLNKKWMQYAWFRMDFKLDTFIPYNRLGVLLLMPNWILSRLNWLKRRVPKNIKYLRQLCKDSKYPSN